MLKRPNVKASNPAKYFFWLSLFCGLLLFACHDAPRKNPFDPVRTPAVELEATLDEATGTTHLTWTPYSGNAPFQHYLVLRNAERRVSGSDITETVARAAVRRISSAV